MAQIRTCISFVHTDANTVYDHLGIEMPVLKVVIEVVLYATVGESANVYPMFMFENTRKGFKKPRVVTHVKRLQIISTDLSVDP